MPAPPSKIETFRRGLKHLIHLVDTGASIDLPDADDLADLVGARGAPRLLLGVYDEHRIEAAFSEFGITQRLYDQGLCEVHIEFETDHPERHTLRVISREVRPHAIISESTLHVGRFETQAPFAPTLHGHCMRMLYVIWLLMQNPRRSFTPTHPALPGQQYPGLGVAHQVDALFQAMARRLCCDGIINRPEFFHTAVLYSQSYRFLDPAMEGRLLALQRDLAPLSLAEASWAVHGGCVLRLGDQGAEPFVWEPEEQILPLSEPLRDHVASSSWRAARDEARDEAHYQLDRDGFCLQRFLDAQGAPVAPEAAAQQD